MNDDPKFFENPPKSSDKQMENQKSEENLSITTSNADNTDGNKLWMEEVLTRLDQGVASNSTLLAEIRNLLENKIGANQYKDEAIVRMQKRLEDYEKGLVRSIKEPLIRDIILFYDSFAKFLEKFMSKTRSKEFVHDVKILREELLQVLFSQDVEIIDARINGKYDRDSQKVVRSEPSDKSEDNEVVSHIIRNGFVLEGKILRKQEVVVKKYIEKKPIELSSSTAQ